MFISRQIADAPRTAALASEIAKLNNPCVGCSDCNGLCKELIEALERAGIACDLKDLE